MSLLEGYKIRPILRGLKTMIPGSRKTAHTGGTSSARYCYGVWLRHLILARANGMAENPADLAELGPGDSIGIGLAGLLSGARTYRALDVVKYASTPVNSEVFEELVHLYRERRPLPDHLEFPRLQPRLASYAYPEAILPEVHIANATMESRVADLRKQLETVEVPGNAHAALRYVCPWNDERVIDDGSVDFIYSQAVLEHVNDVSKTYQALHRWLRPGGFMSHVIDFSGHGLVSEWNGHWAFDEFEWRLVKGARPYLLNRLVLSDHLAEIEKCGFRIVDVKRMSDDSGLPTSRLSAKYRRLSPDDLLTRSAYVFAQK